MAKNKYYFDHDYTARNDDKILELRSKYGAEGYGIFWMIIETMAENSNAGLKISLISGLSFGFGIGKEKLLEIIKECNLVGLFYEEGEFLFSKRLLGHKTNRLKITELRRKIGKRGAKAKQKLSKSLANGQQTEAVGEFLPIYERKLKEIKGNTIQEEKEKEKENFPKPNDFNGLPDDKVNSAIELLRITQKINVSISDVDSLWNVFKVENLTGENFYQTKEKVYTHFIRWVKGQPIKNDHNFSQPKIVL